MDEQTYSFEEDEQQANPVPHFDDEGGNPSPRTLENCPRCGKSVPNLVHYVESTIKKGGRSLSVIKERHLVCVDCCHVLQSEKRKYNRNVLLSGVAVAAVTLIIMCTTNTDATFYLNAAVALVIGVCASVPFLKKGRVIPDKN